jgi:hypothetical protein
MTRNTVAGATAVSTEAVSTEASDRAASDRRPDCAVTGTVPRWANRAAHAVSWCVLPSCVWRLVTMFTLAHAAMSERFYMLLLCVVSESLALLTLGLVRPWGERVPHAVPIIGGRPLPVRLVVGIGLTGAGLLCAIYLWFAVDHLWLHHTFKAAIGGTDGTRETLSGLAQDTVVVCYLPLLAWAPLVIAVTLAYRARRRGQAGGQAGGQR